MLKIRKFSIINQLELKTQWKTAVTAHMIHINEKMIYFRKFVNIIMFIYTNLLINNNKYVKKFLIP